MLVIPQHGPSVARIIGIDPGTTHLGVAILEFNITTRKLVSTTASTLRGDRMVDADDWLSETYGNRFARLWAIEEKLVQIFNDEAPLVICAESPFFNQLQPSAFQALTEAICSIRRAVFRYDVWRPLKLVPPTVLKLYIAGKGHTNKLGMKDAVARLLPTLHYSGLTPYDQLDEHSVDALCVAYYAFNQLINPVSNI